ncbi:unnamed protein product [Hymenolepis diminuta]|uniref:PWWP domain-containing protein n=1 Tax=Hymenolepis diminuta TaxID=6216 RepID=A0A0R3SAU2_HYMDI|nr:unnamed protein product [Hymenolepis diminuta]VUZ51190.1 unnamed protein product [Hymenolepis diminuta]
MPTPHRRLPTESDCIVSSSEGSTSGGTAKPSRLALTGRRLANFHRGTYLGDGRYLFYFLDGTYIADWRNLPNSLNTPNMRRFVSRREKKSLTSIVEALKRMDEKVQNNQNELEEKSTEQNNSKKEISRAYQYKRGIMAEVVMDVERLLKVKLDKEMSKSPTFEISTSDCKEITSTDNINADGSATVQMEQAKNGSKQEGRQIAPEERKIPPIHPFFIEAILSRPYSRPKE